jgi:penicillin-binding protein 1A
MGIRTPVSRNWAMTLGGLKQGVTPLDMAHAYQTFARQGKFVYGTMSPGALRNGQPVPGPVGIRSIGRAKDGKLEPVKLPDGKRARNRVRTKRVLDEGVAGTVQTLLQGVVKSGTGKRAQLGIVPVAGKTGTTENYGDAWFVGWTRDYTVAVWVGYPNKLVPMNTEFNGEPVAGGTFPAGIFKTFMESVFKIDPPAEIKEANAAASATPAPGAAPTTPAPAAPTTPAPSAPAPDTGDGETDAPTNPAPEPDQQQDIPPAEQAPAPPTTPQNGETAPSGGTPPPAGQG